MPSPVLLVEDDEGDAILVRECLIDAGLADEDVLWRRSVQDAISTLADAPGCVLLDLGLPDADGLSALHRLVAAAGSTPVIVLTGRHDRTGVEAVAAGAQDYLVKDDVTPDLLDRSMRYAVERHRSRTAELQLQQSQLLHDENSRLERGLLPRPLLRSGAVQCASYYRPGRDRAVLGGDFFDVVESPSGQLRAVIGDVMGHGPDEAALGVHLRVAWRALVLAGVPEHDILATLAQLLHAESGRGTFVTVCDVSIDPDLGASVRVAGHPPPLICSAQGVDYLDLEVGPPLGVLAPAEANERWRDSGGWPLTLTTFTPGSSLVMYSDGLLDAYRTLDDSASIGLAELRAAAGQAVADGRPMAAWMDTIVDALPSQGADDTAVVVLTLAAGGR